MAQDPKIMAAALRNFRQDREERRARLEQRTAEVYRRLPRVESIDRELRGTVAEIMIAAFENDRDPAPALKALSEHNLQLQRERSELLVGGGYPFDYIDDKPLCPLCEDTGYLRDGSPCRCLMNYYTREQNRRLSKLLDLGGQSFDSFSFDWYSSEVWPQYGRSPLENMETIREICGNYAHTFGQRSGNLLFTGAPGLGKTFLTACIAREVSDHGFSVVYDTAAHIFQQFESGKFGRDNPYEEDPDREINRYLNCDLLLMDDLGTEMLTSFVQSAFYRIINDRLLSRKKTVLSTNLSLEEMGRRYGGAVRSRLEGEYQVLFFFGEDIRILKRDRQ